MGAGGSREGGDPFNCASGFDCFSAGPPPARPLPGKSPEVLRDTRIKISAQDAAAKAKADYDKTRTIEKLVQYSRSNDASGIELLCEYMGAFSFLDELAVDGFAAIHVAAVHGKADAMKELIKRGCSLDTLSKDGKSAEQYAKEFGNKEILVLLEQARKNKQAMMQNAMTPGATPVATPAAADGKELFQTTPAAQGMEGNPGAYAGERTPVFADNAPRQTPGSVSNTEESSQSRSVASTVPKGETPTARVSTGYDGQNISPAFALISEPKSKPTFRKIISLTRVQRRGPTLNVNKGNGGVGISFGLTAGGTTFITGMAPGGPAEVSGKLFVGDELISVNGVTVSDRKVDDVISLIVGEPGTILTLEIASSRPDPTDGSKIAPRNLANLATVQAH